MSLQLFVYASGTQYLVTYGEASSAAGKALAAGVGLTIAVYATLGTSGERNFVLPYIDLVLLEKELYSLNGILYKTIDQNCNCFKHSTHDCMKYNVLSKQLFQKGPNIAFTFWHFDLWVTFSEYTRVKLKLIESTIRWTSYTVAFYMLLCLVLNVPVGVCSLSKSIVCGKHSTACLTYINYDIYRPIRISESEICLFFSALLYNFPLFWRHVAYVHQKWCIL